MGGGDDGVLGVNRQCGSSLEAIAIIADKLRSGEVSLGIGCGVESMTHTPMRSAAPVVSFDAVAKCALAKDCGIPMGVTRYL